MPVRNLSVVSAAMLACVMAAAARADHQPVIAIPGNPHVPVIIDGADASYAVVNGDWGLYAPGRIAPEIYYAPVVVPVPGDRGYCPATGQRPRVGRREVITPRRDLPPAPDFYREWSAGSGSGPVTEYPPYPMPDVSVEPRSRERGWRRERRRGEAWR
jgi:hypothetical protein